MTSGNREEWACEGKPGRQLRKNEVTFKGGNVAKRGSGVSQQRREREENLNGKLPMFTIPRLLRKGSA